MPSVARIGDIGIGQCCDSSHNGCIQMSGRIISGASQMSVENSPPARCGDIVLGNCGHTGVIVSCSPNYIVENNGIARIGDSFVGTFSGILVTGALTVEVNS